MSDRRTRRPSSVYRHGTEPDPRFSLANERTYLAWIRTSLAFLAGGVALEALGLSLHPGFRLAASVLLIVAGILTPLQAWIGWARTERALRLDRPLPSALLSVPIAAVVMIVGVLVSLGILFA
ncbi:YidH family protein [Microbacterium sp. NPDC056044]|uniref:YidH family protein n=1 Tax=Microbacterium sp. NPDC056044 TaxID=3345690 RepID=UPI0035DD87CA